MAADDGDYTARMARQLLEEHAAGAAETPVENRVREAQAKYPRALVYFDPELDDVVVDLSSGGR